MQVVYEKYCRGRDESLDSRASATWRFEARFPHKPYERHCGRILVLEYIAIRYILLASLNLQLSITPEEHKRVRGLCLHILEEQDRDQFLVLVHELDDFFLAKRSARELPRKARGNQ